MVDFAELQFQLQGKGLQQVQYLRRLDQQLDMKPKVIFKRMFDT